MPRIFRPRRLLLAALLLGLAPQARAETTPPQPVTLGSTANFLVLSGAGIQNLASGMIFNGTIGTSPSPGASLTGITAAQVTGLIYTVDATGPAGSTIAPTLLTTAKGDLTIAYNDAFGRVQTRVTQAPELGGLTLAPGLYWSATGFSVSSGDLVLDAGGNATGVWIFQAGTAGSPTDLNVLTTHHITLAGGARAANVFWACRSAILGTSTTVRGNILASQTITNAGNGIFEGRQLAFTAGITFNGVADPSMGLPAGAVGVAPTIHPGGSYIFPSPTRGSSAKIVYTMVHAGNVRIRIHNEAGALVDTIQEDKPAGFQASQVSVGKFAQGVYFYLLNMNYDDGSKESQPAHKFVVTH